ncbi:hypothetical protein HaLaN_32498 [Haematococcus lacustris]|uniref:Uncharacterized protein n=1 Tax=Haematococcus lacustris TaxID=44745 RepID=A0A6A0ALQ9_HAELA|nr:hypothetical protein HaLaN_32498 [Haematococcus lacustris]
MFQTCLQFPPPPPPPTLACDNPIPVILPSNGMRIEVSGSFPVTAVNAAGNQAVLFGPFNGDGSTFVFTNCIEGSPEWPSVLHLYGGPYSSNFISCGGYDATVETHRHEQCTYIRKTLMNFEQYWLMLEATDGNIIPDATVLIIGVPFEW